MVTKRNYIYKRSKNKRSKNKRSKNKRSKNKKTGTKKNNKRSKNKKRLTGSGKYDNPTSSKSHKTPYTRAAEPCQYGQKCTNMSIAHRERFSHECQYGEACERKNPQHILTHHSPIVLNEHGIRLYTNDKAIKAELDYSNMLFKTKGWRDWRFANGNFNLSKLKVLHYNSLNPQDLVMIKETFYFNLLSYIVCHICELIKEYDPGFLISLCIMLDEEAVTGIFRVNKDELLWTCIDKTYGLLSDDLGLLKQDELDNYKIDKDIALPELPRFISNTHIKMAIENMELNKDSVC
jgi:hypothetical protein